MPHVRSRRAEAPDAGVEASRSFLESLFAGYGPRDFAVRFWDGSTWEADTEPRFTLVLNHPGALRAMFWPPNEVSVAEAYLHDDYDIEGDIEACLPVADYLLIDRPSRPTARLKEANSLVQLPTGARTRSGRGPARLRGRRHSLERARQRGHLPLRPRQRVLRTVPGSAHALQLRVFSFGGRLDRPGAGAEARPHLPEAAVAAGRAAARHRLRLGGARRCTPRSGTASRCSASPSASRRLELARERVEAAGLAERVPHRGPRLPRGRRLGRLRQARLDRDVRAHRQGRAAGVLRDVLSRCSSPAASSSTTGSASRRTSRADAAARSRWRTSSRIAISCRSRRAWERPKRRGSRCETSRAFASTTS